MHAIYSDDHGQSWKLGAVDATYEDGLEANETAVVELGDGRLYFNSRDQNGKAPGTRGEAYSVDGGTTFEPSGVSGYEWLRPVDGILDPPVVQCSLLRVRIGDLGAVVFFCGPDENGPTGKGRNDLRIRFSTDETKTWQDGLLIHTGPAAYSDIVQIFPDSDQIGILFEAGSLPGTKYDRIDFVVRSVGDLLKP
jgi:sialidase-1